ncbi:MAG: hypothetical protein LBO76_02045 [Treponema sp.]|nr:hypothetical protein [Treponema sp.]
MYVLTLDFDGKEILSKEPAVKEQLEEILASPEQYAMSAYTRRAIAAHIKRTPALFHSFYVISSNGTNSGGAGSSEDRFLTLSFSGTSKSFYSEGAWIINSETDLASYYSFRYGANEWEVEEITPSSAASGRAWINTERTLMNVLGKIDSSVTYYYNDHISDKRNRENCNTALQNTLAENG